MLKGGYEDHQIACSMRIRSQNPRSCWINRAWCSLSCRFNVTLQSQSWIQLSSSSVTRVWPSHPSSSLVRRWRWHLWTETFYVAESARHDAAYRANSISLSKPALNSVKLLVTRIYPSHPSSSLVRRWRWHLGTETFSCIALYGFHFHLTHYTLFS